MSHNIYLPQRESSPNQVTFISMQYSQFISVSLKPILSIFLLLIVFSGFGQSKSDTEREKDFLKLFDREVQNRAFALLSMGRIAEKTKKEGDKIFYNAWVDFENFLQKKYKPYADKHELSQEPRGTAKTQAFFGKLASDIFPKRKFYKTMLNQTKNYLEKLKKLPDYAAEEDVEFARFVVEQEEVQIKAIEYRIEGKNQAAADLLSNFIKNNS